MKLTQKDRITLIILVIALSIFVGIWFILRPALKEVKASKKDYESQRSIYMDLKKKVEEKAQVKNKVTETYNMSLELADIFYDKSTTYDVAAQVYDQISKCDILVTGSSFSLSAKQLAAYKYEGAKTVSVPLDEYADINNDNHKNNEALTNIATQQVGCYTFKIQFTGATRAKIFELVEALKTTEHQTLVITNLSFNVPEADSEEGCSGTMSLELYWMSQPDEPKFD